MNLISKINITPQVAQRWESYARSVAGDLLSAGATQADVGLERMEIVDGTLWIVCDLGDWGSVRMPLDRADWEYGAQN